MDMVISVDVVQKILYSTCIKLSNVSHLVDPLLLSLEEVPSPSSLSNWFDIGKDPKIEDHFPFDDSHHSPINGPSSPRKILPQETSVRLENRRPPLVPRQSV